MLVMNLFLLINTKRNDSIATEDTADTTMRDEGEPAQKQKCRDYEEKGVCYRGDDCPYYHGTDRISVPTPEVRVVEEEKERTSGSG